MHFHRLNFIAYTTLPSRTTFSVLAKLHGSNIQYISHINAKFRRLKELSDALQNVDNFHSPIIIENTFYIKFCKIFSIYQLSKTN